LERTSPSDPDPSLQGYKNLLEAEPGLCDVQVHPRGAPMFQRLETAHPCPRAAVLAALLLIRVAERRTGRTWRQIAMHPAGHTRSP
jgi:hypothetical protein